ncbi:hypothetical protein PAPYR_5497 [Paratrimastix pyriformis]|uniref:Uncharacterized protein n=1 Tax=Paratrimastix pyriformis TaxID=342808 RepID=A0ABQ8ULB7_9EUKA|nr:hypothetical protein PAPYR_5497 [Paratrimastix pyriformis]
MGYGEEGKVRVSCECRQRPDFGYPAGFWTHTLPGHTFSMEKETVSTAAPEPPVAPAVVQAYRDFVSSRREDSPSEEELGFLYKQREDRIQALSDGFPTVGRLTSALFPTCGLYSTRLAIFISEKFPPHVPAAPVPAATATVPAAPVALETLAQDDGLAQDGLAQLLSGLSATRILQAKTMPNNKYVSLMPSVLPLDGLLIRPCYPPLYDTIMDSWKSLPVEQFRCLLTGVPGIGKSCFGFYFLRRLLNEPPMLLPSGKYRKIGYSAATLPRVTFLSAYTEGTGYGPFVPVPHPPQAIAGAFLVCDSLALEEAEQMAFFCPTFLISSPRPEKLLKFVTKASPPAVVLYMPPNTPDELVEMASHHTLLATRPIEQIRERAGVFFSRYGGVARPFTNSLITPGEEVKYQRRLMELVNLSAILC